MMFRLKTMLTLLSCLHLTACKIREDGSGLKRSETPASLLDELSAANTDVSTVPSLNLSSTFDAMRKNNEKNQIEPLLLAVLTGIGAKDADTANNSFYETLFQMLINQLPSEAGRQAESLPPMGAQAAPEWTNIQDATKRILPLIVPTNLSMPVTLPEHFPLIPIDKVDALQKAVLLASEFKADARVQPFDNAQVLNIKRFELKKDGCKNATEKYSDVEDIPQLKSGFELIDKKIVDCFQENNQILAQILNSLSNNSSDALSVNLVGTGDKAISSYKDLADLLTAQGYVFEFFASRSWADFLNYAYMPSSSDGEAKKFNVRLPIWFRTPVGPTAADVIDLPVEHGEIGLMIFDKARNRLAQVRFYLGTKVSDGGYENIPSFWRPFSEKDQSWIAAIRKSFGVLGTADTGTITKYFDKIAKTMSAFQNFQAVANTPINSYGIFVCSDSLVISLLSMFGPDDRFKSHVFPLLRVQKYTPMGRNAPFDADNFIEKVIGLDAGVISKLYPSDIQLLRNPQGMRARILAAFPETDAKRFVLWPDLLKSLKVASNTITATPSPIGQSGQSPLLDCFKEYAKIRSGGSGICRNSTSGMCYKYGGGDVFYNNGAVNCAVPATPSPSPSPSVMLDCNKNYSTIRSGGQGVCLNASSGKCYRYGNRDVQYGLGPVSCKAQ